VDGLDSTSAEDALSAKQGGVLNASITQAGNNIASLGLRVDNLESLGHYLGTYDTVTAMPNNSSSFTITPTINDFVNIRQDENYANAMTRYVIEAIAGDGTITWSYDITYSTDVTGKADQSALDATNSQLAQMAASLSLIGNPTWYPMVLQNGATTVAGTAIEARYCKIGRVVFFSGIIISDSGAVASVLPSGFRPKGWEEFTVPISTYSGNSGSRSMRIIDNGSLYLNAPVSPSTVHNYFNIACSYVAEN
jgi:hypothetical protein